VTEAHKSLALPALQKRGRDRQQSLLDAAEALIMERGLEGFAMADVAKRAKAAHGSLYQFFASRTAILVTLHARHIERLKAALAGASATLKAGPARPPPKVFLEAYLAPLQAFMEANPAYRILRLGMPEDWEGAGQEAALDSGLVTELTNMLAWLAPEAPASTRNLSAQILLQVVDALFVLNASDDMKAEATRLLEMYLGDLAGRCAGGASGEIA
jgi:AcrR family transcriptional regulator